MRIEDFEIQIGWGMAALIFIIFFVVALIMFSVLAFIVAGTAASGSISLKSLLAVVFAITCFLLSTLPCAISLDILIKYTKGVRGVLVTDSRAWTASDHPGELMMVGSVSSDTNRRVIFLQASGVESSSLFFLPTPIYRPLFGRIRIPVIFIKNDAATLEWLSRVNR